jgi:hypothetical protein
LRLVSDLSRLLFLAGAVPYLVLGTAHAIVTPTRLDRPRGLSPRDPDVAAAMSRTSLRLTSRTDLWRCWIGFNLSHSLGVLLLGAIVVVVGASPDRFARDATVFLPVVVFTSAGYLALGLRYWFRTPILGCALSLALFVFSWALRAAGPS